MDTLVPGTVAAFALGVVLQRFLPPSSCAAVLAALAGAGIAAGSLPPLRRRLPRPFDARLPPLLLALAASVGAARSLAADLPPPRDSLERLLPATALPVVLEGVVAAGGDPARETRDGREPRVLLAIEATALRTAGGWRPASGRVLVGAGEEGPDLLPGDRVAVTGLARPPGSFRNPGVAPRVPGPGDACRFVEAPGAGTVRRLGGGCPLRPSRVAARLRRALLAAVRRAAPGPGGALLEALLVGEAAGLDGEVVRDFRRAGVWHVLVVSGLHAGLAAAAAAWLLASAGAGPGARSAGAVAAAAAVAGASGFGHPALRAAFALALAAAAPLLRRRVDPLHALFAAAGIFLALRPAALLEPGLQLSLAAVLGILRLSPALGRLLFAKRRFLRRFPVPAADRSLRRRAGDLLERSLPPSLAAWFATAPVLALHFGTFSPVTPAANLLVVPAAALILAAAPPLLLAGLLLPGAAAPLLDGAARVLGALVHAAAALPGAWCPVAPPTAYLALLGGALAAAGLRPTPARLALVAAGTALLPVIPPPSPATAPSVTVLDVGHGLAVLAESRGTRVLLDAGGRGARVAADAVLPLLRARGALRLDALLLGHEDTDHYSAAVEVLEALPVGVVVVPAAFGATDPGRAVLAAAEDAGVPVLRAAAGDRLLWGDLEVRILHPPGRGWIPASDNDGSLVARVAAEGLATLVTGDLEDEGLRRLLLSGEDLRADLLVLPHHGSPGTAGVEALAAAAGAHLLVASAGKGTMVRRAVGAPRCPRLHVTADEGGVEVRPLRDGRPP